MKPTFDLFSDYFAGRDTSLRQLDVRLKMGLAAVLFTAILFSTKPVLPVMAWLLSIVTMMAVKIPPKIVFRRFLPSVGIVLVIGVSQALLIGNTPVYFISPGGWHLTIMAEGITQGALTGSRVLGSVGVLLLLSSVTPAHDIFRGLRWCRISREWVEIAMLMYRYIFVFLEDVGNMAAAQRVRLGYAGFKNSLSSAGSLMGAVVVRAAAQSLRTHEAMTARAYGGEYPFDPLPRLSWRAGCGLLGLALVMGLLFFLIEGTLP